MPRALLNTAQDLAGRLGIGKPTRIVGGPGDLIPQYMLMLYETARHLETRHDWQELQQEVTFTTVVGDFQKNLTTFAPDMRWIIDGTVWNRTQCQPLHALDPQQWSAAKASQATAITCRYRVRNNQFLLLNNTVAGESIAFEYASRYWVTDKDALNRKPLPTRDDDLLLLDDELLILGAKWRLQKELGLEYGESFNDYEKRLHVLKGHDTPQETIALGTRGAGGTPGFNLPEGNWGQ